MSNSSLATARYPAHTNNYWGMRGVDIDRIIIHYMYAKWTAKRCCESFQDPNRGASSNYCIGYKGEIAVSVDEELASGCSNSRDADSHGVTIEVANDNMDRLTHSDATIDALVKLCADIAKRNNLGRLVPGKNLCWHSMYAATSCPGQFLLDRMDEIAERANKINFPADGSKGQLGGVNVPREKDMLVLYTGDKSTGTNPFGYEVALDKNSIAIENPKYGRFNSKVPEGGRVLSGHGKAGKWLSENVKEGCRVLIDDMQVYVHKNQHRSVDGVNVPRAKDFLCVYSNGKKAPTNKWGCEVAVVDGRAISDPVYGIGGMSVPEGGYVLSGHGKAGKWIAANIKLGTMVTFDGKKISVNK